MVSSRFVIATLMVVLCFAGIAFEGGSVTRAQSEAQCPVLDAERLESLAMQCGNLESGSVCAGATGVTLSDDNGAFPLVSGARLEAGMRVSVGTDEGVSGVAVMRVPALDDEAGQLSVVLVGQAEMVYAPAPPRAPVCNARSLGSINVRELPSTDSAILGQLAPDQLVPVEARLADGTWWQIPWQGRSGWVFAELTPADCDPATMLVVDPATGEVSGGAPTPPFQAVNLKTGGLLVACPDTLPGGALLQSPVGGADWLLNGMLIQIDGTIWINAPENDVMAILVLEGQAMVNAGGINRTVEVGQLLRIPLRNGQVDGVPGPAMDGLSVSLEQVPVVLLPRKITMPGLLAMSSQITDVVSCSVLPQQIISPPDERGVATFDLYVDRAQNVRVSASAPGLTSLAVEGTEPVVAGVGADYAILPGIHLEAGRYRLVAEAGMPVTFGVTCELPVIQAPHDQRSCDELLLSWDAVQGGEVQFVAPAGAQISALVDHALPSEAFAATLAVYAGDVVLAEEAFLSVGGVRVAGPLSLTLPEAGNYRVVWDGDPFNRVNIEVICEPSALPEAAE